MGTIYQEGQYSSFNARQDRFPLVGIITNVYLQYEREETENKKTPVYNLVAVDTKQGTIKDVIILQSSPRLIELPRIGDRVVIGFIDGRLEAPFIMGYIPEPHDPKAMSIPDTMHFFDEYGNEYRKDENGTILIIETTSKTKISTMEDE